jgi:hypothetical protein
MGLILVEYSVIQLKTELTVINVTTERDLKYIKRKRRYL